MLAGMQGKLRDLFSGTNPAKKLLRDIGLKLADTLPGVKPRLIRQAMGLNDLPEWLRKNFSSAVYLIPITLSSPVFSPGDFSWYEIN
ncbi:hypothetical protein ACLBR5_08375 [Escherichia coli]